MTTGLRKKKNMVWALDQDLKPRISEYKTVAAHNRLLHIFPIYYSLLNRRYSLFK